MRLSNFGKLVTLLCLVFAIVGCGGPGPAANQVPAGVPAASTEFPFAIKEPDVYQAEFFVETGPVSQKWFAARKGELSRVDYFSGDQLVRTELDNGAHYLIDHRSKTYRTQPTSLNKRFIASLAQDFFRGKEYFSFEQLGSENGLTRYRAKRSADAKGEILLTIDEKAGMIVREEFGAADADGNRKNQFVFDVRNLKLEADDSLFALPAGYKTDKGDKAPAAAPKGK